MALQMRTAFCMAAIGSLLFLCILCMNLQVWIPWSHAPLAGLQRTAKGSGPNSMHRDLSGPPWLSPGQRDTRPEASTVSWDPRRPGPTQPTNAARSKGPTAAERLTTAKQGPQVRPTPEMITEPPFIGDRYSSEDPRPLTTCQDTITGKWPSTDFNGRFLATIPVLQWAKHVTPQQYQRLKQFSGTFGWGGLDYETLNDTLSALNLAANGQMFDDWERRRNGSQCIRCAVVGNGGILNGSRKGQEIDSHDYVFRTNGAIINGFEEDVGKRTTHYTFSTNTMRNSMRSYNRLGYKGPPLSKETRYVFLPDHDRDYLLMKAAATHTAVQRGPEKSNSPPSYFGDGVSAEQLKMYHPDFVRYLRNRFLRSGTLKTKHRNIYRPSTGSVMLLAAVHTCDQVSAYGYMTPDYAKYSDHYFDKTYHKVVFYINHDFRMEMNLWQKLHAAGLVRLYMGP